VMPASSSEPATAGPSPGLRSSTDLGS
jgi:hypothetical protein